MNPGIIKLGLAGMAGLVGYKLWKDKKESTTPSPPQAAPSQPSIPGGSYSASTNIEWPSIPIPNYGPMSVRPVKPSGGGATPTATDYQTMTVASPQGIPVTVATPIAPTITPNQASGTPIAPPIAGPVVPVPTTVPNLGTIFAPPNTVQVTPSGDITQPAPIVVTPTGSSSVAVGNTKDVQRALNTLGIAKPKLTEDGVLGPKTVAAIRAFQSSHHLSVDGNAGPATKAALSAALLLTAGGASLAGATAQLSNPASGIATTPNGAQVDTTPALSWGAKDIQHGLNILGTTPKLTEDGQSGPKTVAAVKSFQTAHGLTPDGIAGPKTKTALYLAVAQATKKG